MTRRILTRTRKKIQAKSKMVNRVHRISYFRKDGTYVKPTSMRVKSLPALKSEGLRRYGYSVVKSLRERRNSLMRALLKGHSKTKLIQRLGTLTKSPHPISSLRYRMDKLWLSKI